MSSPGGEGVLGEFVGKTDDSKKKPGEEQSGKHPLGRVEHGYFAGRTLNCLKACDFDWSQFVKQTIPVKLPLLSVKDKGANGGQCQVPEGWDKPGAPFFWRESKSADFWTQLLAALCISDVFDMTASTQLLKASVQSDVAYTGLTSSGSVHAKWLTDFADREFLKVLANEETDLAQTIAELFGDSLESEEEDDEGEEDTAEKAEKDEEQKEEETDAGKS